MAPIFYNPPPPPWGGLMIKENGLKCLMGKIMTSQNMYTSVSRSRGNPGGQDLLSSVVEPFHFGTVPASQDDGSGPIVHNFLLEKKF